MLVVDAAHLLMLRLTPRASLVLAVVGGTATFHGARPPSGRTPPKKGTVASELLNWKAHGYPAGLLYSCNKTAWFKWREAELLFRLLRFHQKRRALVDPKVEARTPRSAFARDAYSVHEMEQFKAELTALRIANIKIHERMTKLLQVGDVSGGPHRIIKCGVRAAHDAFVLSQPVDPKTGKSKMPVRAQSATWAVDATLAIPKRVVARCFIATHTLRPEDYPDDLRREYDLDALLKHFLADGTRVADVIDDPELRAQLEDTVESDDESWTANQNTPHASTDPDHRSASKSSSGSSASFYSTMNPPQQAAPQVHLKKRRAVIHDSSGEEPGEATAGTQANRECKQTENAAPDP